MFIKIAVREIPPMTLAAGRVSLGALLLVLVIGLRGDKFPRNVRSWLAAAVVAVTGIVIPFFLIGWGQRSVDAALAAISMSSVPLFTLPLAHLMTHDEKFTALKGGGVVLGFAGVALLVTDSMTGAVNATPWGIAAILFAAFCYALAGLLIRKMPGAEPVTTAGMILTSGTLILIPLSCALDRPWTLSPGGDALLSVAVLGVFATGLATLCLVRLIGRVGATFTSLNNYLVPVIGIGCGVVWLDESLSVASLFAFAFIVAGIVLTSRATDRKIRQSAPLSHNSTPNY